MSAPGPTAPPAPFWARGRPEQGANLTSAGYEAVITDHNQTNSFKQRECDRQPAEHGRAGNRISAHKLLRSHL